MSEEKKLYYFETFGLLEPPVVGRNIVAATKSWWDDYNEAYGIDISNAIGCYMFTMGKSHIKPWYVGKTVNSFRNEIFTPHKLRHYNEVINRGHRGPPGIYLFPLLNDNYTSYTKLSGARSSNRQIEWLEKTLIGMAYSQNQNIQNVKDVTGAKRINVRGIIGQPMAGRPHAEIGLARQALLGKKN